MVDLTHTVGRKVMTGYDRIGCMIGHTLCGTPWFLTQYHLQEQRPLPDAGGNLLRDTLEMQTQMHGDVYLQLTNYRCLNTCGW